MQASNPRYGRGLLLSLGQVSSCWEEPVDFLPALKDQDSFSNSACCLLLQVGSCFIAKRGRTRLTFGSTGVLRLGEPRRVSWCWRLVFAPALQVMACLSGDGHRPEGRGLCPWTALVTEFGSPNAVNSFCQVEIFLG